MYFLYNVEFLNSNCLLESYFLLYIFVCFKSVFREWPTHHACDCHGGCNELLAEALTLVMLNFVHYFPCFNSLFLSSQFLINDLWVYTAIGLVNWKAQCGFPLYAAVPAAIPGPTAWHSRLFRSTVSPCNPPIISPATSVFCFYIVKAISRNQFSFHSVQI